jgi:hypothetical protein
MGNDGSTSWYRNCSCGGGGSASLAPLPQLKKLRGVTKLGLLDAMALPLAMNAAMSLSVLRRGYDEAD